MTYTNILRSLSGLGLVLFGLAGCSQTPSTVPVKGVLLWEDGKPVAGANISFVPGDNGRQAAGYTGKDGDFELSTFTTGDGATVGDYTVTVTKFAGPSESAVAPSGGGPDSVAKAMKAFDEKRKAAGKITEPIPEVYHNAKTSPLKAKVESGGKAIELKIKRS